MINLGIDENLIIWIKSFPMNRKIQLVIDGHDNKKREIETSIPQGLPVSPIFFSIYISGGFDAVEENNPAVIFLLFLDDLGFIASSTSVKEIFQALGTLVSTVLH